MTIDRMRDQAPLTRGRQVRGGVQRIRLLVADDHAVLRQALRVLLESQPGLEVAGEATNGRDAVEAAERLNPDVVLMDMVMPGLNGIDATYQILKRSPGTRVLILTAYLEDERLLQALRAGASGYVVKNSDLEELVLAIQSVHRGNTYFSTSVSDEIAVNEVMLQAKQPEGRAGYDLLTNREREVLQLIAEGLSNQAIGEELVISVKTVEAHRAHIMTKLHAKNRTDLIRYALKRGLVGLESPDSESGAPDTSRRAG
ncbi:MAG: response regulator transcription factor [Chloroflexi bacterium]|nr:response regulator transcription factor [Chloroflexota bacterium]MDA1002888.1 response regulator transcription factor [Chloroflexota bacterium]